MVRLSLDSRFWSKVSKTDTCWFWTGEIDRGCYGMFSYTRNDRRKAHRVSYLLSKGNIHDGYIICHTCDNRSCVNPDHLYIGTHADNARDRSQRNPRTWIRPDPNT